MSKTANQNTRAKLIGDLVSILGAAIVFFSWILTNTLQQDYQSTKANVQRAASDHRVHQSFMVLKGVTESIAYDVADLEKKVAELSNELREDHQESRPVIDPNQQRLEDIQRRFERAAWNSHNIDLGYEFCIVPLSTIGQALSGDATEKLKTACQAIKYLQDERNKIFLKASGLLRDQKTLSEESATSIRDLIKSYSDSISPRLEPAMLKVVEASNMLFAQMRSELEVATTRANLASNISLFTYILGTVLVLAGRLIDKIPDLRSKAEGIS